MHLIKKFILFLIVFLFVTKANSSIFVVDNYLYATTLEKIKKNRNKEIESIKQKSLNDFLKSITTKSDFKNIEQIKNYQEFFKTFIVKNEFKNNVIFYDEIRHISKNKNSTVDNHGKTPDNNLKYIYYFYRYCYYYFC